MVQLAPTSPRRNEKDSPPTPGTDTPQHDFEISSRKSDSVRGNAVGVERAYRNRPEFHTRTVEEILADPNIARGADWLIDTLIPRSAFTILYGSPKAGKTTFLTHLAAAVVSGTPFLGREINPGPVVWLDLEQSIGLTGDKLALAGAADQAYQVHIYNGEAPSIRDVEAEIHTRKASLLIVDSLSKLLKLRDENDAAHVTQRMSPWVHLAHSSGVALVAIHHDRKKEGEFGRSMRGSTAIAAAYDVSIALKVEGKPEDGRRKLEFISRYDEPQGTLLVRLEPTGYVAEGDQQTIKEDRLLQALGGEVLTIEDLEQRLSARKAAWHSRLNRLVESGRVLKTGVGKKGDPFRYQALRDSVSDPHPQEVTQTESSPSDPEEGHVASR